MKSVTIILFFALCACVWAQPAQKYTTKYDNVDIDQVLKNDRLLRNYVNCLLGGGRCTKDGAELKRLLPDAIHTKCSKCSEVQKSGAKKIIRYLIDHKRAWWNELEAKYDPNGSYRKEYESEIKKQGFNV